MIVAKGCYGAALPLALDLSLFRSFRDDNSLEADIESLVPSEKQVQGIFVLIKPAAKITASLDEGGRRSSGGRDTDESALVTW